MIDTLSPQSHNKSQCQPVDILVRSLTTRHVHQSLGHCRPRHPLNPTFTFPRPNPIDRRRLITGGAGGVCTYSAKTNVSAWNVSSVRRSVSQSVCHYDEQMNTATAQKPMPSRCMHSLRPVVLTVLRTLCHLFILPEVHLQRPWYQFCMKVFMHYIVVQRTLTKRSHENKINDKLLKQVWRHGNSHTQPITNLTRNSSAERVVFYLRRCRTRSTTKQKNSSAVDKQSVIKSTLLLEDTKWPQLPTQ